MGRCSRIEPARQAGLAAALMLSLVSCAEFNTLVDVAFPQTVPGLPADQPWISLPVRRWLTETGIEPVAISACLAETCREPAVVGLFRARGAEAVNLARAAGQPAALMAALETRRARPRRDVGVRNPPRARIDVEGAGEGGAPGFVIRLSRADGSRSAAGYVVVAERPGVTELLVIVAGSEAGARDLARRTVPYLNR